LRLRTSSVYKTSHSFGQLFPDSTYENLFHVAGCDQFKTFTFDFEFCDTEFGSYYDEKLPTLQMAFAFSCQNKEGKLERRTRIASTQASVAINTRALYSGANVDAILCLLTHKILRSTLDDGFTEGNLLLQDWLTIFLVNYNHNVGNKQVDFTFEGFNNLSSLCRCLFGLSKTLLNSKSFHPDLWNYYHCLFSGLEPHMLRKALYPILSVFLNENKLEATELNLNFSQISSFPSKIFLLDAFHVILAYYNESEGGESQFPFPPSKDCLIRKLINSYKQERHIVPRVLMTRSSVNQEQATFSSYLLEEDNAQGMSYSTFLENIQKEVTKMF